MEDRDLDSDLASAKPAQPPPEDQKATENTAPSTPATPSTPSTSQTNKSPAPSAAATPKVAYSLEDASKELTKLVQGGSIQLEDVKALKATLKEHANLKEKVDKLKSLLGRSAKAQRETKVDLEATQKRLGQSLREIERLNQKLDKLQSRPTHLDLLMDFETNFDKAILSVGQTGGEDTAPTPAAAPPTEEESALDTMLMQELGEAKARIEKLESLNSAMLSRSTQLESSSKTLQQERDEARQQIDRLQMELRMAKMEAEHATRAMQDKAASLEEMQIEIDLVTKASAKANSRAAKGEEMANSVKSDRQKVQELESQVQALQEWALASAESKRLVQERCTLLEKKLKHSQGRPNEGDEKEKLLFQKNGSMVIGAGDKGSLVIALGHHASEVDSRFVILKWKFDFSPPDLTIGFNVVKGKCETASEQGKADYLIKDRSITGGAGGETEGAFNTDAACTLIWSNASSWIRPRTVKYNVDVVSLK